jgi:hypothetical protein
VGIALRRCAVASYMRRLQYLRRCQRLSIEKDGALHVILRIIYGPEYTLPEHLERLKSRGLGTKRFLHFPLTIEAHLSRQGRSLYGEGQSKQ